MNWPQSTIADDTDPVGGEVLSRLLQTKTLASVHYVSVTGSTSEDAKVFAASDSLASRFDQPSVILPRLFLADRQTQGRGRRGRTWLGDESSLAMSLLIRQPLDTRLSLAVGVAIAEAIESQDPSRRLGLKWPNDVMLDGGKLAGILIETVTFPRTSDSQAIDLQTIAHPQVIGIGINLGAPPSLDALSASTGELSASTGEQGTASPFVAPAGLHSDRHRYQWLPEIVTSLLHWIEVLAEKPEAVIEAFSERCVLSHRTIRFQHSGHERAGMCRGIQRDGRLGVEINGSLVAIESGEVHQVR
jgi:BirA family transcriptional regulator, biotin operon repressor / biotin---[acetyl-CoA-carboxylase] ligase